jgi:signal transduction histidine kinase
MVAGIEARGPAVLASLAEGVVLHDANGRVTTANEAAERLLGKSLEHMLGHSASGATPPCPLLRPDGSALPPAEHPVSMALRTGSAQSDVEVGVERQDGSIVWLSVNAQPVRLPHGDVAGGVCSFFDVTQRRQALQRSKKHLRSLADNVPDAIVRFDRELRVLFANEAAAAAPPEQAASWDARLVEIFRTGEPDHFEFSCSGSDRCYESRLVPEYGHDGAVETVLSITRDITDRKHAERQLLASREQLRALVARLNSVREEEKAHLSRELHDEMGQVLTALRMELEALEDLLGEQNADAAALVDRSVAASELVTRAIESLRGLLATLRPVALDRLGLGPALRQECRRFQEWAGIPCVIAATEDVSSFGAEVDTALFRIAREALTNVARHAGASRAVVTLEQTAVTAALRVEDDGRGIPAGREAAGLGVLGMRERAERLGGTLILKTAPGGGTMVEAFLPRRG